MTTKRQFIGSMLFPVITLIWGIMNTNVNILINEFPEKVYYAAYPAAVVFGGILPAVMMIVLKLEVSGYLRKRLFFVALGIVLDAIVGQYRPLILTYLVQDIAGVYTVDHSIAGYTSTLIVCLVEVICEILFVPDDLTTGTERAVLILSNPFIYKALFCCLAYTLFNIQSALQ